LNRCTSTTELLVKPAIMGEEEELLALLSERRRYRRKRHQEALDAAIQIPSI